MIELYSWYTSNGRKVSIALEELGLPYEIHPIDITRGEQTTIEFMRVSPNGKIPAIVDQDAGGRTLMESGAILLYLADKLGRLISKGLEDGYFIRPAEAYLQVLYDDPGFAPIRASQEARQARERKRFLDMVCNDNPFVAYWQPAEGTCEQFTVTGRS